ncbi:MAG: DUF262 domain-containing protein [Actinomycetes bacterium]
MEQLKAQELPVHKVLSSDFNLRIPKYQRPYSWSTEMALQLLDDLLKHLENHGEVGPDTIKEPYFLGSVVIVKPSDEDPESDVIDGQQRLTTLTLLLAVLRDHETNESRSSDLDALIREKGNEVLGISAEPRLHLRERDAKFFRERIQDLGATKEQSFGHGSEPTAEGQSSAPQSQLKDPAVDNDSKKAILSNAIEFRKAVRELLESEPETVPQLERLIMARTFLVVVSTPSLESAYRIFAVMNSRGLDLSPADIFKADVIGAIEQDSSQAADDASTSWEDAEEALGRENFADLFLHIRMIFAKERAKRELSIEFPEQVMKHYLPDGQRFMDEVLVPYAHADDVIRTRRFEAASHADEINHWLTLLARIDNNDWRPPALWAVKNRGADPAWLAEFLRQLERLAASMFIRRVYTTGRATRYGHLLRDLDEGAGLSAESLVLTDSERHETLEQLKGDIYLLHNVNRPVLLRLDELLSDGSGATYAQEIVSVEHVLPQQPSGDSQWCSDFTKSEQEMWTHKLANLVLLSRRKNSEARNFDFDEKKSKYFTSKHGVSNFAVTSQVLNQEVWTPQVLEVRQEELIGRLANEWDLLVKAS